MSDDVPRLDPNQQRMVEAYLGMDQGLAVLASVPGAGKSATIGKAAAEDLLARSAAGDPRPHERVLIASFSKEDAADLCPDIVAWIEALYERGETPPTLGRSDIDRLCRQVREAPRIGTVDSVLRTVCGDIATEMGFDGMPTVGNPALIEQLHQDAYERVIEDDAGARRADRLRDAYDTSKAPPSIPKLLRDALEVARRRTLTPAEFENRLHAAVADNYRGGSITLEGLLDAIIDYRGAEAAADARDTLTDAEQRRLLAADQQLHTEWVALIETFGDLFTQYADAYETLVRERGVITHTDCAWLVETYFRDDRYVSPRRERLHTRYREAIDSVIIDEAQDVSRIQHDAVAHLVADDACILLAGDLDQCIYQWRDATPDLFAGALEDGQYFNRTWRPHATERAERNYRSRPGIVRFVNAVAERGLGHAERGGLGHLPTDPPAMTAIRDATGDPAVHIASFDPKGAPGSDDWVAPKDGMGEAATLARYVASGINTGRFPKADDEAGITVLFRRRTHMPAYADAFRARGMTVADASAYLFDSPVVRAVIDVIEWLANPTSPERTHRLLTESALASSASNDAEIDGLRGVAETVTDASGVLRADAVGDSEISHTRVMLGLVTLQTDTRLRRVEPASVLVREVIDRLELEVDPLGIDPATESPQRVATLDALVALVEEWEDDDRYSPARLHELLTPFLETPSRGPTQPVADADAVDVVFRTIHDMKGDQDDIVVVADMACSGATWATGMQTLVASAAGIALAPPATAGETKPPALPGVGGGLYDPTPSTSRARTPGGGGLGLRWDAEHWIDEGSGPARLCGPPVRRAAAAETRAEWWRTLHVALTRAQEHLIIPLPRTQLCLRGRDHWAHTCWEVLGEEVIGARGTHTVSLPDGDGVSQPTSVAVDQGSLGPWVATDGSEAEAVVPPQRPQRVTPATDIVGEAWQPRFLRPSLLGPLVDDPAAHLVSILREQTAQTETDTVDPDLPITFASVTSETVGEIVHTLVARLVRAEMSAEELCGPEARGLAVGVLEDAVEVGADEWDGLYTFLVEDVLEDLAVSELWSRVERATAVYVEEPLHGVTRVNGVDVEVQGAADLVLVLPDGTYHIEELKVRLAPATESLRRRYRMQAQAYAWVLTQQVDPAVSVEARVTTVGTVTETYAARSSAGLRELF
ncbi:UvrD-helicase domain-containing protein [Halorubrum vacuolatum]|nr:UvrD-helicase domain-containing protein [Halorubrum vacuolatum]